MIRHIRFVVLAAVMAAVVVPTSLSADQRSRSNPRPSGGQSSGTGPQPSGGQASSAVPRSSGGATAVPRQPSSPRPYYNFRYYSPGFYSPGFYGYRGFYGYPGFYGFRGFYGYPGFYSGFYNPYFWSYGLGVGYGQYPYPPYYSGPYYQSTGSARLQVTPRNTQVYIDGYFVGVVDNFDGNLQRLNVEAGEHELQLYLEGYRPFTQKVLFPRGGTLKVTHAMQPLGPGEVSGPLPKPDGSLRAGPSDSTAVERQGLPPRSDRPSEFGSLLLRVRPEDADIMVDGELWRTPAGEDQFAIELSEGPHRIEVRKDGHQGYSTTVRVRRGDTVRLNVSLTAGGPGGGF